MLVVGTPSPPTASVHCGVSARSREAHGNDLLNMEEKEASQDANSLLNGAARKRGKKRLRSDRQAGGAGLGGAGAATDPVSWLEHSWSVAGA